MTEPRSLEIPTLPAPRARALLLLTDERSDFHEISETIESDPALTIAVLRAANSAASASRARIESAHPAIVRLGIGPTRRIVTGAVVGSAFSKLERAQLDVDSMWRHFVATALIADAASRSRDGHVFTAGLLHDIGRLAMAAADPDRYAEVVIEARAGLDEMDAECELFGRDHTAFGYRVATEWGLPQTVADVALDHHAGEASAESAAVHRARSIAWSLGLGDGISTPTEPHLDLDSVDGQIVRRLHGPRALMARIEWYRGAMQPGAGPGQSLAA